MVSKWWPKKRWTAKTPVRVFCMSVVQLNSKKQFPEFCNSPEVHGLYQVTPHQRYATEHVHSFARYTLPLNVTRTLGRWGIPLDGKFACCFVSHQRSQSQRVQFGKMLITAWAVPSAVHSYSFVGFASLLTLFWVLDNQSKFVIGLHCPWFARGGSYSRLQFPSLPLETCSNMNYWMLLIVWSLFC